MLGLQVDTLERFLGPQSWGDPTQSCLTSRNTPRFSGEQPRKIFLSFWQRGREKSHFVRIPGALTVTMVYSVGKDPAYLDHCSAFPAFLSRLRSTAEVRSHSQLSLQRGRASEKGKMKKSKIILSLFLTHITDKWLLEVCTVRMWQAITVLGYRRKWQQC